MFAKSRGSGTAPCDLLPEMIRNTYEIGKQSATAGPEHIWRIYDGYRKKDRMEISIFLFDKRSVEKIHKPKRKDAITDILRESATRMERISHPKLLQVYKVEECADTLAFASEPILASLSNVLAYKEQLANTLAAQSSTPMGKQNHPPATSHHRSAFIKEYELLELEIKYGLLQITEALLFLHGNCKLFHKNVCPTSIVITKRGTWKLSGFEFIERINDNTVPITVQPWTKHMPKMTQPNLDYIAPEVQQKKVGNFSSDMYSLGMTICAIYNQGRPLILANHSCSDYLKQLEALVEQVSLILPMVPIPLREAVTRLLHKDPEQRPTAQILTMIKFFKDPLVHALQFLDVSKMKDVHQKEHFYTTTLKELLPYMPKKLWYQHIWTYFHAELQTQEVLSAVLQPILYIVQNCTQEEYDQIVFPTLKPLFTNRKSIQGTVILLENLHIILQKTPQKYECEVLAMLYTSFENSTIQVRTAAFVAVSHVTKHLADDAIRTVVLPKLLEAFKNNAADSRILMDVVSCILSRLEKQKIIDCILPLLCEVKLQEPELAVKVVRSIAAASAEKVVRKNSMKAMFGNWFTSTNDSNFLRVTNTFTSRRLSDNTLMTPKIRIAPSCASSPGGTPGGVLPIRRHSSTGPQERRGSNINLSPPTGNGMPITSSSVPYLLSSSLNSVRGSRRPSVSSTSSQQSIGLLQQVGSSMVRQLPPICLNVNGPPPPPTHSPSLQLPGQHSH